MSEDDKAYIQPVLVVSNRGHALVEFRPVDPVFHLIKSAYVIKEKYGFTACIMMAQI